MRTSNIFRKVGDILTEINEQYQYLSESPENLNDLELELLSANADFLAEHIKVLKKLNLAQPEGRPEPSSAENHVAHTGEYAESVRLEAPYQADDAPLKQEFPEAYENFNKPVSDEIPVAQVAKPQDFTPEVQIVSELPELANDKPYLHEASADKEEEENEEPAPPTEGKGFITFPYEPEAQPAESVNPPVIQDAEREVFDERPATQPVPSPVAEETTRVPTLNELISAQLAAKPSAAQTTRQPVTDLKSIINLNDKLLFIKDLFNGYSLAYSEAVEILNRFDSFDAADNFLKTNYAAKNNWASKQATADKFYELLNRRFSK